MTIKDKIAFILHILAAIIIIIMGIIYLLSTELMPYHIQAIGKNWSEFERPLQILLRGFVIVIGGGFISLATTLFILLFIPYRQGRRWVRYAIPVIVMPTCIPVVYVALIVKHNTPANPPWLLSSLVLILIIGAFIISIIPSTRK